MKLLACYPPGIKALRSEERCQADVDSGITLSQRACNDLGYIASIARMHDISVKLRDYPAENTSAKDFLDDIKKYAPDILIVSCTAGSVADDAELIRCARNIKADMIVIAKGAFFTTMSTESLPVETILEGIDYALTGEIEAVLPDFLDSFKPTRPEKLTLIGEKSHVEDMDSLPFPARDLMKNELYIRPDTGKPMATIETSRGCPSKCIYCLTPVISGSRIRSRSPENIVLEIKECVEKFGITDFFFRSDTFTMDEAWVQKICALIISEKLKISWAANSRTRPLSFKTLKKMKAAGCWVVALGFESGSSETLRKIGKGTKVKDSFRASGLARKAGLQVFGFFMLGFPWETEKDILETGNLAIQLDCDYAEFHIATAFQGTELYDLIPSANDIDKNNIGVNYFSSPNRINHNLSPERLVELRKKMTLKFYLRPRYVLKRFASIKSPQQAFSYLKYGIRTLLKSL